jgi:peptide/nickel transport system permease protein
MRISIRESGSGSGIRSGVAHPLSTDARLADRPGQPARAGGGVRGPTLLAPARRFAAADPLAALAAILLLTTILASLAAPLLAPADPHDVNNALRLRAPGESGYLLGSDELGRDILSRLMWGGRISLLVAIIPTVVAVILGTLLGIVSGYFRGWLDEVVMRVVDVLLAFPYLLLTMAIAAALGPGWGSAMVALTVGGVPVLTRLVRATVLSLRERDFVTAARAIGASTPRIMRLHILPNTVSILVVYGTLQAGSKIIAAAALSFLGLGVQQPEADWGGMLASGRAYLFDAPHVATIPGLVIFAVSLAFNMCGEALRDWLDPRMRHA